MKTFLKLLLIALFISAGSVSAQKVLKLGHINSSELFALMPEKVEADKQLAAQNTSLQTQLEAMTVEYNKKREEYFLQMDSLQDIIKRTKEEDINILGQRIETFTNTARQDLQNKEAELYNPLVEKVRNAIKEVAAEKDYDYVFDTNPQATTLLHFPESDNLMEFVKAKLGIKE